MDVDFRLGSGPVVVELTAVNPGRAKAVQTAEQALLGDVDGDGQITIFDAMLVMLFASCSSPSLPVGSEISLGDVDADGLVTVGDAWLIATYLTDPSDPVLVGVGIGSPIDAGGMVVVGETRSFPLPVQEGYAPLSMDFVWIEPGVFQMGSPESEEGYNFTQGPLHEVEISRGFWLGKYEVTQGEWEAVMGETPWAGQDFVQEHSSHPAEYISWYDTQSFIGRLNAAAGDSLYRLPSEAEWEYACRAGTQTRWSFGDDDSQLTDYAWYWDNAAIVGEYYAHAVGTKLPNPWGLYDMHGNVHEWVQDWVDVDYYNSSPRVDPPGPSTPNSVRGNVRVIRGGGFTSEIPSTRSARRGAYPPSFGWSAIGVRLVRIR